MRHLRLQEPFDSVERERAKNRCAFAEARKEKSSEQDTLIVGDYKIEDETIVEYSGEDETITIPEGVKRIASDAFHNNKLIRKVVIHDGIKEIGDRAFSGCSNLEYIELPKGLQHLSDGLFSFCENLKTVVFPEVEFSLGGSVFCGCYNLYEDDFLILDDVLVGCCSGDNSIQVPTSIKKIGKEAFQFSSAKRIVIPSGVEEIEYGAFWGCENLKEIEIPESVKQIGKSAFQGCRSLEKVILSPNITILEENLFALCSRLKVIKLPEGVKEIQRGIFLENYNIEELYLPESVQHIDEHALGKRQKFMVTIYAPKGSYSALFAERNKIHFIETGVAINAVSSGVGLEENEYEQKLKQGKLSYKDAVFWKKLGFITGDVAECCVCKKAIHSSMGIYYKDSRNKGYAYCSKMCELFSGNSDGVIEISQAEFIKNEGVIMGSCPDCGGSEYSGGYFTTCPVTGNRI